MVAFYHESHALARAGNVQTSTPLPCQGGIYRNVNAWHTIEGLFCNESLHTSHVILKTMIDTITKTDLLHARRRRNMIQGQARAWQVLDPHVLGLLEKVPRAPFIPSAHQRLAYADTMLPLAHDEYILRPSLEARILQEMDIHPTDRILEVGTGCGYLTALLAFSATDYIVHSVEWHEDLYTRAVKKLSQYPVKNVELYNGDAHAGWPDQAPYDAIVITGSLPSEDHLKPFYQQMRSYSRLFAVIGDKQPMQAILATRLSDRAIRHKVLFETWLPPLLGVKPEPIFRF